MQRWNPVRAKAKIIKVKEREAHREAADAPLRFLVTFNGRSEGQQVALAGGCGGSGEEWTGAGAAEKIKKDAMRRAVRLGRGSVGATRGRAEVRGCALRAFTTPPPCAAQKSLNLQPVCRVIR